MERLAAALERFLERVVGALSLFAPSEVEGRDAKRGQMFAFALLAAVAAIGLALVVLGKYP